MRKVLTALSLIALLAGPAGALSSQQQKMKDCNASATSQGLKGSARQDWLKIAPRLLARALAEAPSEDADGLLLDAPAAAKRR